MNGKSLFIDIVLPNIIVVCVVSILYLSYLVVLKLNLELEEKNISNNLKLEKVCTENGFIKE